ncbi:hypothetical protein LZK98_11855 [Sphingomonas cannabina]|uniref:hypothetical protein n=1 Tax=Sphingomonas cannabina TaxID=2899123 RepID=UPI001F36DA5D|nr:hypothetical protein [Sphingomonas cannabina]UIJ43786.1 hypothetical protein LZK98_11855 [Sphingomonas cannabina]
MADTRRLVELGMVPELAKEVSTQINDAGITPGAAIADLAGGADLATTVAKVNAILAALRTAGIIAAS